MPSVTDPDARWKPVAAIAAAYGVHANTVRRAIPNLPAEAVRHWGRVIRIDSEAFAAYIDRTPRIQTNPAA